MAIVSVIVDDREPAWSKGLTFDGAPVLQDRIDTDVLILLDDGTLIGVERKEANDFLNTLRADRLFPQLEKLRALTPWAYLVICGDLRPGTQGKCITDRAETGWNWSSVAGALLTVQEIGIHVIQCRDTDFERTCLQIANRDRGAVRVQPARDVSVMSEAEALLTALPGIGPEKAEALIRYCGTAAWSLAYLCDSSWPGKLGVGEGIKRKVRKALGLDPAEMLGVVNTVTGQPVEREKSIVA